MTEFNPAERSEQRGSCSDRKYIGLGYAAGARGRHRGTSSVQRRRARARGTCPPARTAGQLIWQRVADPGRQWRSSGVGKVQAPPPEFRAKIIFPLQRMNIRQCRIFANRGPWQLFARAPLLTRDKDLSQPATRVDTTCWQLFRPDIRSDNRTSF